ncbi:chlorophyll A-B binding protein [Nitzschia inconspicua]|uniref:Chlorophyll A-B binding protein n=1 Tax=Nitzschia inconspicua TaxID=303405 RepID=A0A9K3PG90_9STRA|nr:chlorophyll A-B binding protein [Nitzschia inconspicua]
MFRYLLLTALAATCSRAFVLRETTGHGLSFGRNACCPLHMASGIEDRPADWRQLPTKTSLLEKREMSKSQLSGTEISIGRIAMLGFVGLLVGEILNGESFIQQFLDAFQFLIGAK